MSQEDVVLYEGYLKLIRRHINDQVREIILSDDAVGVLIVNASKTKILLVRQFRAPLNDFIWEIPAGMLDIEGETPEECMAREILEECNLTINPSDLTYETSYYPVVGSCTHKIHLYSAITEEVDTMNVVDDDVVEAKWFSIEEINTMIRDGIIIDGKTQFAFYKVLWKETILYELEKLHYDLIIQEKHCETPEYISLLGQIKGVVKAIQKIHEI